MKAKNASLVLISLILVLPACAPAPNAPAQGTAALEITDAWVRAPTAMGDMGASTAAYMVITNTGSEPDAMLTAESDVAMMGQLHLSEVDAAGVSSMHEVESIDVPSGGSAELKPGGYHVMLLNLKQDLKPGDIVTLALTFEQAGRIEIQAIVRSP